MLGLSAEDIGKILLAVSLLITGRLAHQKGKEIVSRSPETQGETMELRGAVISDRAADRLVMAMDAYTASSTMLKASIDRDVEAKQAMTKALSTNSLSLDRNSDTADDLKGEIRDVRNSIERLKDEMIRRSDGR